MKLMGVSASGCFVAFVEGSFDDVGTCLVGAFGIL